MLDVTFYETFAKEAAESYSGLPDETNELYKRHHIRVSKQPGTGSDGKDDANSVNGFLNANKDNLDMGFDAIIGSRYHLVNNKSIKITDPTLADDALRQMMHKNGEDKYSSFINAHSKRFITIELPRGQNEEIKLLFLNSEDPLLCHVFINAADNSNAKLVELFASSGAGSAVGIIHEIRMGNYSNMELDSIHNENSNTTLLSFCKNSIGSDSKLKFNTFYNGTDHTRARNVITAEGARSEVNVNEAILGSSSQKFDISTQILNLGKESHANLDSKAVVMDNSFCIMKGFAKVLKGASNSRSYVHERGIILDKGARIDGLPDMSVDENEVKATHSSATSPVDPESVFYLMSKGISELGVRKLIVSGFIGESISKMHNDKARAMAISMVNYKLETKQFGILPKLDAKNSWMFSEERDQDMFLGHYKYR